MKQEINPMAVIAIIVLLVAGVGWFLYSKTGGTTEGSSKSMPMPKEAAEGMAKMQEQLRQQRGGAPGGGAPAPGR